MDEGMMDKVSALLSDPEMSAKIAAIAGSLAPGGGAPPQNAVRPAEEARPVAEARPAVSQGGIDPRIALLSSIKPLLRQEKRQKMDNLVKAMTLVNMLGGLKRGGDI